MNWVFRSKPFTVEDQRAEAAGIRNRRQADTKHTEFPMTPPVNPVQYVHYPTNVEMMAHLAVEESWNGNGVGGHPDTADWELPRQIVFDNTHLSIETMNRAASLLVVAAMRLGLAQRQAS
jgi:hypothetical protein